SSSTAPGASSASSGPSSTAASSSSTGAGGPCIAPLFTDDFSGGLGQWQAGLGDWQLEDGGVAQVNDAQPETLLYVPATANYGDIRLQAKTRMVSSGGSDGTTELVARADPNNPGNRYWCGFQHSTGWLIIRPDANYLK